MLKVPNRLIANGFERFVDLFAENEVDVDTLRELTDDHLRQQRRTPL